MNNLVTEDNIDKKKSLVFDIDAQPSLPNVNDLMDNIMKLLEFMNQDEVKLIKRDRPYDYDKVLEDQFPDFANKYFGIFKIVQSGKDISPLFDMLAKINLINKGKLSFEDAEKNIGEKLANKYIK